MKYLANCTYCISQVMNIYSNRKKNRILKVLDKTYIEVETEIERSYIQLMNTYLRHAYNTSEHLISYLQDK